MIPERIETARLLLRPLVGPDVPRLVEALADWQVVKWLAVVPWPYTTEDADWFVRASAPGGTLREAGERTWALSRPEEPEGLLGVVGLGRELGYWLASDAWGQGLATEAARAVLAAHFAKEGAGPVASGWFDGNGRQRAQRARAPQAGLRGGGSAPSRLPCARRGRAVPRDAPDARGLQGRLRAA